MSDRDNRYTGIDNLEAMEAARNYNRYLTSLILDRAECDKAVLDFGAGTGTHAKRLRERGLSVSCVETDPQLRSQLELEGFEVAPDARAWGPGAFGCIYSLN